MWDSFANDKALLSRYPTSAFTTPSVRECLCRLPSVHSACARLIAEGQQQLASLKRSHGYLLHGNNPPHCYTNRWASERLTGESVHQQFSFCFLLFFLKWRKQKWLAAAHVCVCLYLISFCIRGKGSNNAAPLTWTAMTVRDTKKTF